MYLQALCSPKTFYDWLELMMMWWWCSPGCMSTCGPEYQRRTDGSAETVYPSKSFWEEFHWKCQVPDNLSWSVYCSSFQLPTRFVHQATSTDGEFWPGLVRRADNVRRSLRRVARAPVKQAPEARRNQDCHHSYMILAGRGE